MATVYFNQSNVRGTIDWTAHSTNQVIVSINLENMIPNEVHAIHIHEFGDISGGCMTSGKHWNPTNENHGSYAYPERGRHLGDLINNIVPDEFGKVNLTFVDYGYCPSSIFGRTVVIHSLYDDLGLGGLFLEDGTFESYYDMTRNELVDISRERKYPVEGSRLELAEKLVQESLKTGNAGGRMACAVIGRLQ